VSGACGFGLFLIKTLAVLLVLSSITVATGRLRIDQLNDIGWRYIASAALVQVGIVLVINYLWVTP
jgi:NADH-quinone oxidoreductase subunit H